jgi:hypothetical protein
MEITSGPYCSGGALDCEVFFAANVAPHRPAIFVPNELIGRLERDGTDTKTGWIAMFERHRDEIAAAVEKAIADGDMLPNGEIHMRIKHFPAGRI